ncbi:MAG TPA: hypothetical protein VLH56_01115 [Dissulfurispiraceae bacterium]|nr:hypothetical protein [Dissulfurispiraceae bacterium]
MKIDPLLFLILIEGAVIFFGLALIFFFRSRKHKKLYERAQNTAAKVSAEESHPEPVPAPVTPEPWHVPVAEEPAEDVPANIRKLLEIIDFQKQKILELLCMRDMLDDAHRQLEMLRQKNIELEGRIVGLVESSAKHEEFGEASAMLAGSNREFGNFLSVLQRHSIGLGEKMATWEEQLKVLWEEARTIADEIPGADVVAVSGDVPEEVSRLAEELQATEEKLKKTQDELGALKSQYEDIEKEYMILYSKQQAGTLGQP